MKISFKNKKGFTLIELLVVISIISLLSSIVMASLNSARAKARNAARLSAIHTLVNAFNLSLSTTNPLPSTCTISGCLLGVAVCVSATCYEGLEEFGTNASVDAFLAPSLPQKPLDPVGGKRGYGGFLYINPQNYNNTGVGAYILYYIESPGSCGGGAVFGSTSDYISCFQKLD